MASFGTPFILKALSKSFHILVLLFYKIHSLVQLRNVSAFLSCASVKIFQFLPLIVPKVFSEAIPNGVERKFDNVRLLLG